jgi:hypothetical protein
MVVEADMDFAAEEGAGAQHHRFGEEANTGLRDNAFDAIAVHDQIVDGLLENAQVRLIFENGADRSLVQHAVGLCARRPHCGTFARVQDPELNTATIGRQRHRAAECVDFLDQMTFADAADRRVAGHLAECFDIVCQQQRFAAEPSGSQTRLGAGMAAADHDDIETLRVIHRKHLAIAVRKGWRLYGSQLVVQEADENFINVNLLLRLDELNMSLMSEYE